MANIISTWANDPIDLSNSLSHPSWSDPGILDITGGKMLFKNDAVYQYIAFDMTSDTVNDPVPAAADGDYFWLLFDRDKSGAVSSGVDTLYSPYKTNTNKLGRSFMLSTSSTTGLTEQTVSQCRAAFEASPNSATAHKIFKIRLTIADLTVSAAAPPISFPIIPPIILLPYTKIGVRYHSTTPNILVESPVNVMASFAAFHKLFFALRPTIPLPDLGPVMGSVGLIPTTKINAAGKATTAVGYYIPVTNASFGGGLNIIGNRTQMQTLWAAGARKYKIKKRYTVAGTFSDFRSAWTNYRWNGSDYVLESFGPDASDFYPMPNPATDYSIDDLLVQFNSVGLENGMHQFQAEFYNAANTLMPTPAQTLTLNIDNAVPQVMINNIKHAGVNVDRCGIVNLTSGTDGIRFNITVNDPEGNLLSYALGAGWGNGEGETITSKSYNPVTMGTSWTGETIDVPAAPALWIPHETCAHGFTLSAYSNVTNGYGMIGYNSYSQYITLMKP